MNVNLRVEMKGSRRWLVSMQCRNFENSMDAIEIVREAVKGLGFSVKEYQLEPANEMRGGQRHKLNVIVRVGEGHRPEKTRAYLVGAMVAAGLAAGRTPTETIEQMSQAG